MKKLLFLFTIIFITSCSSSNHVCGGSGGKRCVQTVKPPNTQKFS